jgi:hypothetical protein
MGDPERLLDGTGTPLERILLQELCSYQGPKNMRTHTLAAIGVTGSTGLAAAGVVARVLGSGWRTKLLTSLSVTSVLLGVPAGYLLLKYSSPQPVLPASASIQASPPLQRLPAVEPVAPTELPVVDTPARRTPVPVARVLKKGAKTSTDLRAELEALDTVRSTLARGDLLRTLSLLDAYFQNFSRGRLRLEAEILRIDALARSGQTEAARSYSKDFLRRHPTSVHTARLQSIVGH